jgi:hypothetical protein
VAVAVTLWMGTLPFAGRAADEPGGRRDDPVAQDARRHYEEGTKAFNLGEYPRAVTEFKAAYNAKPDPLLLYNIAQAYRLGADPSQALFFYRSFLRNMPAAPNRKEVEGRIRTLEKQVEERKEEQKHEASVPVATPVTPPAPSSTRPAPTGPSTPSSPPPSPLETKPAGGDTTGKKPTERSPEPAPLPVPTASPPVVTESAGVNPALDLSNPSGAEAPPPTSPFYKKWWFWTGVGVVLLLGLGVAAAARDKAPATTYGLHNPVFVPPAGTP